MAINDCGMASHVWKVVQKVVVNTSFSNEGYSLHHLYLATHTSDNQPNYITKSSIQLQDDFSHEGPEYSGLVWLLAMSQEFPTQGISGKITVEQRILHDGDVNKYELQFPFWIECVSCHRIQWLSQQKLPLGWSMCLIRRSFLLFRSLTTSKRHSS